MARKNQVAESHMFEFTNEQLRRRFGLNDGEIAALRAKQWDVSQKQARQVEQQSQQALREVAADPGVRAAQADQEVVHGAKDRRKDED